MGNVPVSFNPPSFLDMCIYPSFSELNIVELVVIIPTGIVQAPETFSRLSYIFSAFPYSPSHRSGTFFLSVADKLSFLPAGLPQEIFSFERKTLIAILLGHSFLGVTPPTPHQRVKTNQLFVQDNLFRIKVDFD